MNSLNEIDDILKKEISLFSRIYEIEKEKEQALLKRDASTLDKLSFRQEELATQVNLWDEKRVIIQKDYTKKNFKNKNSNEITLNEIVQNNNSEEGVRLRKSGDELRGLVKNIYRLQDLNKKLIKDNLDMIGAILNEIKERGTVNMGYDRSGKEKGKVPGSVLFNKTV